MSEYRSHGRGNSSNIYVALILAAIIAVCLLGTAYLVFQALDPVQQQIRSDQAAMEYARGQLELERQELELLKEEVRLRDQQEWGTPFARVLGILSVIAVGTGLLGLGFWLIRREPLVWPDEAGMLPVAKRHILVMKPDNILELAHGHQQVRAIDARYRTPQVPGHYAPHLTVKQDPPSALPQAGSHIGEGKTTKPVASFSDMLRRGDIGPGKLLHLGFQLDGEGIEEGGDYQDIRDDLRGLYSAGIGGLQGSGKTTTTRFLLGQLALFGAKLGVIDPHFNLEQPDSLGLTVQPLKGHMVTDIDQRAESWEEAIEIFREKLERRKTHGWEGDHAPWVLAVDEFTAIMRHEDVADSFRDLLQALPQEGRKWLVFCLLLGQGWKATQSGGTEVRDALNSYYIHRMKRRTANLMLGLGPDMPQTLFLPPGQAYLYRANAADLIRVQVPWTTERDLEEVAQMAARTTVDLGSLTGGPRSVADLGRQDRTETMKEWHKTVGTATPSNVPPDAKQTRADRGSDGNRMDTDGRAPEGPEARVVSLFATGRYRLHEIARMVYPGITDGRLFDERLAQVEQIIARELSNATG